MTPGPQESDTTTETDARPPDTSTEPAPPVTPQQGGLPREAGQDETVGDPAEGLPPGS